MLYLVNGILVFVTEMSEDGNKKTTNFANAKAVRAVLLACMAMTLCAAVGSFVFAGIAPAID